MTTATIRVKGPSRFNSSDPDADYGRLIRPWKSQLGLLYVRNASMLLNIRLIWLTIFAILDKPKALAILAGLLNRYGASDLLQEVARRDRPLEEFADRAG